MQAKLLKEISSMNKNMQNLSAGLLAAALSFTCMPASVFAEEKENSKTNPENGTEKTETVYTFINEDGDIKKTLVSSWIHNENGIKNIKENLDLKEVENVKTEEEPVVKGDEYTWSVEGKDVYYQGVTDKELPVTVDITYELDGKRFLPKIWLENLVILKRLFPLRIMNPKMSMYRVKCDDSSSISGWRTDEF